MDNNDASSVFGVAKPRSNAEEQYHRELERRSLDIIRVKNPDKTDFHIEWDKRYHRVPAMGTADVPRYIAMKYCRDKAIEVINSINEKMHEAELEDRAKKGLPAFESKWHENQATYIKPNYPRTDDKVLLAKLYSEYWVGLVYEFGKDMPNQVPQQEQNVDLTPVEEKILNEMRNRRVDLSEQAPVQGQTPISGFEPKEALVDEVTVEDAKPTNSKTKS